MAPIDDTGDAMFLLFLVFEQEAILDFRKKYWVHPNHLYLQTIPAGQCSSLASVHLAEGDSGELQQHITTCVSARLVGCGAKRHFVQTLTSQDSPLIDNFTGWHTVKLHEAKMTLASHVVHLFSVQRNSSPSIHMTQSSK